MTKRKRTYEQVVSMQAKAVRLQANVGNFDASIRIESLSPEEYAARRNVELVAEPVRKRRPRKDSGALLPFGYAQRTEVREWTSLTETGRPKRNREVRIETWKISK